MSLSSIVHGKFRITRGGVSEAKACYYEYEIPLIKFPPLSSSIQFFQPPSSPPTPTRRNFSMPFEGETTLIFCEEINEEMKCCPERVLCLLIFFYPSLYYG